MKEIQELRKTRINPKIIKFAKRFNIEFRVGPTIKSCKIVLKEIPQEVPAAYFGQGVIFVRDETPHNKEDMDIICLHELGHALLGLFPLTQRHFRPFEEVAANMVALTLAAQIRLPITASLMKNFNKYNKDSLKKIRRR